MKPTEYPEEFLNSKISKEYLSELISKLEDSTIQIQMEEILGDSKTKTILQVYEASKKLSRKRNKEAKQVGEELSNMVKECFADYTKLYESTSIKETIGSETSKAKKTLFEKLKTSTSNAFTSIKKKKKISELKRSLRREEYEEAVEIALELNSQEASDVLIDKVKDITKFEKFDVENVYTLLKGADDIATKNDFPNDYNKFLNNLISSVIHRIDTRAPTKGDILETLHKLTLSDPLKSLLKYYELIYFKYDSGTPNGERIFNTHTYDELKKVIEISQYKNITRENELFIASKLIDMEGKLFIDNLNKFTEISDSDKRELIIKVAKKADISPAIKNIYGLKLLNDFNLITEEEKSFLIEVEKNEYLKFFSKDMGKFELYVDYTSDFIKNNLDKIIGVSKEKQFDFAMDLIKYGNENYVFITTFLEHLKGIKPEQHKEIVLKIIDSTPQLSTLCENINIFKGIKKEDHEEIFSKIIDKMKESGYRGSFSIDYFQIFDGIPKNKYEFFVLKMIDAGFSFEVLKNFEKFNGKTEEEKKQINLNHENVINKLIEKGNIDALCYYFQIFNVPESKHEKIIVDIFKRNVSISDIPRVFEKFTGIPKEKHEQIAIDLIRKNHNACESVFLNFHKFKGIPKEHHFYLVSLMIKQAEHIHPGLLEKLNSFEGITQEQLLPIYVEIMQYYTYTNTTDNSMVKRLFEKISELNLNEKEYLILANNLIERSPYFVLININNFKLNDSDREELFSKIIKNCLILEHKIDLINLFRTKRHEQFKTDAIKIVYEHNTDFSKKHLILIATKKDLIHLFGEKPINDLLEALPNAEEKRNAFTLNKYDRTAEFLFYLNELKLFEYNKQEIGIVTDYIRRFGLSKTDKLYTYFRDLKLLEKGQIQTLSTQQIKDKMTSLELLENKFKILNKTIYGEQPLLGEALKKYSAFELEILNKATGKSTHKFDYERPTFEKIISDYISYSSTNSFEEGLLLAKKYGVLNIKAHKPNISFDKLTIEQDYLKLRSEILFSLDSTTSPEKKLNNLKEISASKIDAKLNEVIELNKNKSNDFLRKQIEFYTSLKEEINNSKTFDDVLFSLLKIDRGTIEKLDLTQQLRWIVLYKISEKNYTSDQALASIESDLTLEISSNSVLSLINIIDNFAKEHVLNLNNKNEEKYWDEKTWESILESKKNSKKVNLLKIFNPYVDNLRKESEKFVVENEGNSFNVSCIPDRGFIGEMSGYLANVCYTAEKEMLRRYPNVIPYKFVVDESEEKRFIGSVLVFELKSKEGEKVALLRAFDVPKEDEINIPEFIENFINSITPSVKNRGITKIIIPGTGSAVSNYHMTLNHLSKYNKPENKIALYPKFDFNNYNITDNCYVVRTI